METTLGFILQLLILICQLLVCALCVYINRFHRSANKVETGPEVDEEPSDEKKAAERQMQEYIEKMQQGMTNIFNYDGTARGDKH